MDSSALTTENIVATVVAGVGIGVLGIWKYLKEMKSPTTASGDRIIPGLSIADMNPIRGLVVQQKRIADALDGIHTIMHARQVADAAADEDELRDRIRDLERSMADAGRVPDPRRRR